MIRRVYKVHTNTLGRFSDCIRKAMYGVTRKAIINEIPNELLAIRKGDIVFISEREVSRNALFGPFYVVSRRDGIVGRRQRGLWIEIDESASLSSKLAYWVTFEKMNWCILFDQTLIDKLSIVWPYNWKTLKVELPSWGQVSNETSKKLIDFAIANEQEAKEFLEKHGIM